MAVSRQVLTFDADGLERLAAETGDDRLADAAEALREICERENRRHNDRHVHDLLIELAELCAGDLPSIRAKARRLEELAREYERGEWKQHRHRVTSSTLR